MEDIQGPRQMVEQSISSTSGENVSSRTLTPCRESRKYHALRDNASADQNALETDHTSSHSILLSKQKVKSERTLRGQLAYLSNDRWLWEVASLILSVFALVAMATLLIVYQGRALNDWPYRSITINAVISLLSLVSKASLLLAVTQALGQAKWLLISQTPGRRNQVNRPAHKLVDVQIFDDASRGPWGALRLLFKIPNATWGVFGAVIILLSALSDPFAQQLVTFPSRRQNITEAATFGLSNLYIPPTTVYFHADGSVDPNSLGRRFHTSLSADRAILTQMMKLARNRHDKSRVRGSFWRAYAARSRLSNRQFRL